MITTVTILIITLIASTFIQARRWGWWGGEGGDNPLSLSSWTTWLLSLSTWHKWPLIHFHFHPKPHDHFHFQLDKITTDPLSLSSWTTWLLSLSTWHKWPLIPFQFHLDPLMTMVIDQVQGKEISALVSFTFTFIPTHKPTWQWAGSRKRNQRTCIIHFHFHSNPQTRYKEKKSARLYHSAEVLSPRGETWPSMSLNSCPWSASSSSFP